MTPFEHQQKLRSQILGCYGNAPTLVKSKEDKPLDGETKDAPASVNVDEAKKEEKEKEEGDSSDDDIEKGGEGSKGGKVVGHTKSGKPIYANANHASHKEFTHEDHKDAYHLHDGKVNEHMDKIPAKTKEGEGGEDEKAAKKNITARDSHLNKFNKKYKEATGKEAGLDSYKHLLNKN
jgi:hypothetical protein